MRRNKLMSNLTQMYHIGNENIDDDNVVDTSASVEPEINESEIEDEVSIEKTPEDTTDVILQEQHDQDVTQEEGNVAFESITMLVDSCIRRAFALEEIADQLNETIQGDGDGINPIQAQLLTTGSELMDEEGSQIAVENFYMNQRMATESLRDSFMEKAKGFADSVSTIISNVVRATRNDIRYTIERIQASYIRLMEYRKQLPSISEQEGQNITDEATLTSLRKHMAMTGDGNKTIINAIKQDGLDVIKRVQNLILLANKARIMLVSGGNTDAVGKFYQEVNKLKTTKYNLLNIEIDTPESFDFDSLINAPMVRSVAKINLIAGAGNQTYTVITKNELSELIENCYGLRNSLDILIRNMDLENEEGKINWLREIKAMKFKNEDSEASSFKAYKMSTRVVSGMNLMIIKLVNDITSYTSTFLRHAVLLTAASFNGKHSSN